MNGGFTGLDFAVVVGYMIAIAAFGSSFYRRKATARDYFLGGRSMSWIPVGISILAADLSAITVMGTPAWAYAHNLELALMSFCFLIVAPIVLRVFVPFYSRLNLYTAYEYLERRFDLSIRLVTSALFLALRGLHVAVVIYAPSLVIQMVTGLPVWQCVMFMGGFTTLYTTLGGVKAVIWTDVIQFGTVSLGILLLFGTALAGVPGGAPAAYQAALEAGRLKILNLSTDPSELTALWPTLIGGIVLCMAPLTTDQAILQRLFTTRSEKDCRRSIILQAVITIPVTILLFLAGSALFAFYHFHPERMAGLTLSDAVVPFFALHELPQGISGLIVASIFSASMAVMSAGLNSLTTATTVDFYQRLWRPDAAPEHYGTVGRIGTVCWGVAVTFLALYADRLGELALAYNKVSSIISGPLLGIFLLATLARRATARGVLAGAALGMVAVGLVSTYTNWSFFYLGPVGVAATFSMGLAASLFTPPPSPEKVRGLVVGGGSAMEGAAVA